MKSINCFAPALATILLAASGAAIQVGGGDSSNLKTRELTAN